MDLNITLRQRQQLSQAQIQSLEILSMDNIELNQFLKNEYLENPLLDHSEETSSETVTEPLTAYYERIGGGDFVSHNATDEEDSRTGDFSAPKENLLRDALLSQLNIKLYSKQEWQLFIYMIDCLDDNGFFTMPIKEVAQKVNVPEDLVNQSLTILKELEPYGVFSANLQECLLHQLNVLDLNTEVLTRMVLFHLQDIADGKINTISQKLLISTDEVRKNIKIISHLNPRPLSGFGTGTNTYIIPDIIFQKESNKWSIHLNDSWIENYHLNDYYINMMNSTADEELISYFKAKLTRLNCILQNIEQRRKTILDVSRIILDIQRGFLEGEKNLVPMTMADVAKQAGIHTSTVSRAIKGKYLQYPNGSILLKSLFTGSVSSKKHGNITPMQVKQYIKKYIETEDKSKPYSDQALSRILNKQNIQVSRRAIAKYREELGIKGSFGRRTF